MEQNDEAERPIGTSAEAKSAAKYRDLFLPYQKRINGWIHRHAHWKTFMHCCGGIAPMLDAVVEAEFGILNPVQCFAKGMDPHMLKRSYGDQLVFWGGDSVFCTIHNIQANTPIENVLAMFDVVMEYQ